MVEIAEPLNACREFPGPILLLAGPGTGKTYQLAKRANYLLEERAAKPEEIAVITFTNEAARNMRERLLDENTDVEASGLPHTISTMHSLANTILGSCPKAFGLDSSYRVLGDRALRAILLQDAAAISVGDRSKWRVTDECRRNGKCHEDSTSDRCRICSAYREILRKCSAVDYDEQVFLACKALSADEALAGEWRARTRYLLVDEYQDINEAQFKMISLLAQGQEDGLFAVGDDDQSIYSFRGGSPKYIREFAEHFGANTKIGRLSKSWRCPGHILRGARAVVEKYYVDREPKPSPTFSDRIKHDDPIEFFDVPSDTSEASLLAMKIREVIGENHVIVIIPNSNYFPPIRDALRLKGIPYRCKTSPAEDGIVRFAAISKWAEAPHDSLALRHLVELVIHNHNSLTETIGEQEAGIKTKRLMASDLVASLWEDVGPRSSLLDSIESRTAGTHQVPFLHNLKRECLDRTLTIFGKHGGKKSHLAEFLHHAGVLVAPGRNPNRLMSEILEWKNELFEPGVGASVRPVEVYTLQSAKGLQADIVFVVAVTEGLLPDPRHDIQEQSRLFYVAMTRPKRSLVLFSARKRSGAVTFQQNSYQLKRSRFIDAISSEHIETHYVNPRKKT